MYGVCIGLRLRVFCCLTKRFSLPALRHVSFPNSSKMEGAEAFLKQHGSKLHSLETKLPGAFELYPALNLLVVSVSV